MSHYPSWGLETRTALAAGGYPVGPHYPSWGLETRRALRVALHRHLITPHGDWKPEMYVPPAEPAPKLITPHGDGKLRVSEDNLSLLN